GVLALPHRGRAQGARRRGHPGHADREAAPVSAPVRWTGRLSALSPEDLRGLLGRGQPGGAGEGLRAQVAALLAEVQSRGGAAAREVAPRFYTVSLAVL